MNYPESHTPHDLLFPPDLDELLETGVTDLRQPQGLVRLYEVAGHPELLVRDYGIGAGRGELELGLRSVERATRFGVNVLPWRLHTVVDHNYVVTAKVAGTPLDRLLADANDQLLRQTDTLYVSLGSCIIDTMRQGGHICDDIYEAYQYMHGTIATDPTPKIRLVDLPDYAYELAGARKGELYNMRLFEWVNALIAAEQIAGTTLHTAHLTAAQAFELSETTPQGTAWVEAFTHALEEHQTLDRDESPIADLRTF